MAKTAAERLARLYVTTGAPLSVLAATFGRSLTNLSAIINGYEPSQAFAGQIQRVKSLTWDRERAEMTLVVRVPKVRQNPAQRAKAARQVGTKRRK